MFAGSKAAAGEASSTAMAAAVISDFIVGPFGCCRLLPRSRGGCPPPAAVPRRLDRVRGRGQKGAKQKTWGAQSDAEIAAGSGRPLHRHGRDGGRQPRRG